MKDIHVFLILLLLLTSYQPGLGTIGFTSKRAQAEEGSQGKYNI